MSIIQKIWTRDGTCHTKINDKILTHINWKYTYDDHVIHRINGPAIVYKNNDETWWLNGYRYHDVYDFVSKNNMSEEDMTALILKYGETFPDRR